MGNNNTREARLPAHNPANAQVGTGAVPSPIDGSRPRARSSRADLGGFLGLANNPTAERRETKQEREARRLEKERQARLVERERSMREEHVDGGYLVTLGTYVGIEDFSKPTVRQLQIDRRLAPFWRGLDDFSDTWTEYQLAAAARGLPIPPPDQPPPEGFFFRPGTSTSETPSQNPAASSSALSSSSAALGPIPVGALAGTSAALPLPAATPATTTSSLAATNATRGSGSSPFKPRAKALAAALNVSSRNASSTDITPREIALPHDPYVNGQPIEVFLYKDAEECPICFLSYPPYLNHTRCCGQAICSECFVQIKRPDPHYPENHGPSEGGVPPPSEEEGGQLISEPACCPYCQQSEFGVTYDPPPFRRGLVHSAGTLSPGIAAMGTAMSSSSSIGSAMSPTSLTAPAAGSRRRTQSLSASAPNVVTTDRVRPDWATKLASQRAHIARRAAAATALHSAAFLNVSQDARPPRTGRFGRRSASAVNNDGAGEGGEDAPAPVSGIGAADTIEPGPRTSSGRALALNPTVRRTRMEELEELMYREALRQSLATEEERRRKEEAKERKEAKRREKEERKAAKAAAKRQRQGSGAGGLYPGGAGTSTDSGHSSGSASSLSLSLSSLALGNRRRGNSGASNLRVEASVANAIAVSGGSANASGSGSASASASAQTSAQPSTSVDAPSSGDAAPAAGSSDSPASHVSAGGNKGKGVDRRGAAGPEPVGESSESTSTPSSAARFIPSPQPSAGPSHLRQMSSASSVSSSQPESPVGSFGNTAAHLQDHDPRASGLSLGSRSAASDDADTADDRDPSTSTEAMFNFSSLAEIVGVQLEGPHAGRRLSAIAREEKTDTSATGAAAGPSTKTTDAAEEHVEHAEETGHHDQPKSTPQVIVTAETPVSGHESA